MQMIVTDRVVLHRRGDPRNEYRELLLCDDGYLFTVRLVIGFASSAATIHHREELGMGKKEEMRQLFGDTAAQLCEEGFSVCD
jgi:hypothetical protein